MNWSQKYPSSITYISLKHIWVIIGKKMCKHQLFTPNVSIGPKSCIQVRHKTHFSFISNWFCSFCRGNYYYYWKSACGASYHILQYSPMHVRWLCWQTWGQLEDRVGATLKYPPSLGFFRFEHGSSTWALGTKLACFREELVNCPPLN